LSRESQQHVRILGKKVHLLNKEAILQKIRQGERKQFIIAQNPEKVMKCLEDEELDQIIEHQATLLIADGIGIILAGKLKKQPPIPRVTGVDLFESLTKMAADEARSLFLYGASPEVNAQAVEVLKDRYPQLSIAGAIDGYEQDQQRIISAIQQAQPDFLFVALGTPRQEKWIAQHLDQLPVQLVMGVGGSFDVLTGNVKRAPEWMQRIGIEWLHRLLSQPTRAGRMLNLPRFLWRVLRHK
jgi:N-acetylglucosaminyldiphosphoundecaprenol N-acetyl-beta-D-mannosaminyltransferase